MNSQENDPLAGWEKFFNAFVTGVPIPQGSMRNFKNGRITHVKSKELTQWRNLIRARLDRLIAANWPDGPIALMLDFYLPRPDFAKGRKMPHKRHHMNGDIDKLTRSVLDALTSVRDSKTGVSRKGLFTDDVRVCKIIACKHYATPGIQPPGVRIQAYRPLIKEDLR